MIPRKTLTFEPDDIMMHGKHGMISYAHGKVAKGAGLGYWICQTGQVRTFVPTHLITGYRLCAEAFYSEEICQQYLQEIAQLEDWTQSEVLKDPAQLTQIDEIGRKFWIEDAAATAGGGQW